MAEIATIARPYAEALFKASGAAPEALVDDVAALATVAQDPTLRQFADHPKVSAAQVYDIAVAATRRELTPAAQNFLRTVLENGRLAALPEMAAQFHKLVSARSGVSDALVQSAFEIGPEQLAEVVASLEQRFNRKLNARVEICPELIGGIRVVVGDEVLDTSVKSRLEQMKTALAA